MATASQATTGAALRGEARAARFSLERVLSPTLLSPSIVALFVFVYGFIGYTVWVSLSNWGTNRRDLSPREPLLGTYQDLFGQTRFQIDLRNTFVFTLIFLFLSVGGGLLLAILLDRKIFGSGFFRSVFLFPYALSFITTCVAWRWIFYPDT